MNGNRYLFQSACVRNLAVVALCVCGVLGAPVSSLAAGGSAPAMSGVKEMLVQNVRFGNETAKNACGVREDELSLSIIKALKGYGAPAVSVLDAKPPILGIARIEIIPEVLTSSAQGMDCTSWLSLTAQTRNTLLVPPVETPRSVIVTYWRGGVLVSSTETTHHQILRDTFDKLVRKLSQQYRLDQPPELPPMDDEKQAPIIDNK